MSPPPTSTSTITVYRFRFLVLLSFCLVNAANAILWISFAPISSLAQLAFQVDATHINALSICFMALYLPGSVMSTFLFNKYSLRTGLLVGAAMTACGAWIRYASGTQANYGGVLFGQCLAGLAQPCFTNIPAKVASRWFPVRERDLATVVGSMFNAIGIAVGSLVGVEFVSLARLQPGMQDWLLVQAIVSTVAALLALGWFRDRPPTPASPSQDATVFSSSEEEGTKTLKEAWRVTLRQTVECFQDANYRLLFAGFALGLGMFNSLTTMIEQLTRPACATPDDASTFSGLLIGLGLVGAAATGVWLDRTHSYRLALRVGYGLGLVLTVALTLVLQPGLIDAQSAVFALLGLVMLPMLPTCFSVAAEATFPVPEDVSSGLLMLSGQLTGIVFIFALEALIPQLTAAELAARCGAAGVGGGAEFAYPGSSVFLVVIMAVSCASIFGVQLTYKRLNVDAANSPLLPLGVLVGDEDKL